MLELGLLLLLPFIPLLWVIIKINNERQREFEAIQSRISDKRHMDLNTFYAAYVDRGNKEWGA